MKQFVFNLDKKRQRPIIVLDNMRILIDTGAKFPIWTSGEGAFVKIGGYMDFSKKPVSFTGFGGITTGKLGRLNLIMGDIIFPNMPIILSSADIMADIILGASNFEGMIYQINTLTHKMIIDIPDDNTIRNLALRTDDGKITVYLTSDDSGNNCPVVGTRIDNVEDFEVPLSNSLADELHNLQDSLKESRKSSR